MVVELGGAMAMVVELRWSLELGRL